MSLFANASALIAIITGEAEAGTLADAMEAEQERLCSALSVWETVAGLCRSKLLASPLGDAGKARYFKG